MSGKRGILDELDISKIQTPTPEASNIELPANQVQTFQEGAEPAQSGQGTTETSDSILDNTGIETLSLPELSSGETADGISESASLQLTEQPVEVAPKPRTYTSIGLVNHSTIIAGVPVDVQKGQVWSGTYDQYQVLKRANIIV